MNASSLVNFRGNWSPKEQNLVTAAATEAEDCGLPSCAEDVTTPWMAIRTVLNEKLLYAASRLHVEEGLLAQCASDLASRIRQLPAHESGIGEDQGNHPFFQLAYTSTATDSMEEDDLQKILRKARSKNENLDITGLLLHAHGYFLQVLEGPESKVRDLYATIREDSRHTHVETLHSTQVAERTFPEWKMGLEDLAVVAGEEGVSPFLQTGELPVESDPQNGLLRAIDQFRRNAEAAQEGEETNPLSSGETLGTEPQL